MSFRKLWEFFCTFVGIVSGVVSIILIFITDKSIEHTCLKLLSKDGHIHTVRMVILRENCNNRVFLEHWGKCGWSIQCCLLAQVRFC